MPQVLAFPVSPLLPPRTQAAPIPAKQHPPVHPLGRHQYAVPLVDGSPSLVVVTFANGRGVCPCFAYDWDGDCRHVQAVAQSLEPIHA